MRFFIGLKEMQLLSRNREKDISVGYGETRIITLNANIQIIDFYKTFFRIIECNFKFIFLQH